MKKSTLIIPVVAAMTLTPTSTSFAEINKDTSSQVQNFIATLQS